QESLTPFSQARSAAQNRLSTLDHQTAQILAAVSTDATAPLFVSAVVKGWIEAQVLNQLLGIGKALDIANEGHQSKHDQVPHPTEPHAGQQLRVLQHFSCDETAPMGPLLLGVAQLPQ